MSVTAVCPTHKEREKKIKIKSANAQGARFEVEKKMASLLKCYFRPPWYPLPCITTMKERWHTKHVKQHMKRVHTRRKQTVEVSYRGSLGLLTSFRAILWVFLRDGSHLGSVLILPFGATHLHTFSLFRFPWAHGNCRDESIKKSQQAICKWFSRPIGNFNHLLCIKKQPESFKARLKGPKHEDRS